LFSSIFYFHTNRSKIKKQSDFLIIEWADKNDVSLLKVGKNGGQREQ
jgi:hypothetical protein